MSRARYEPVPQRDEVIILDSIHNPNYNFNTGIPNSVPSSQAPSLAGTSNRSIPNSPPPSFHTHSSPGTPRPTPSTTAASDYAELWGVAPSSISLDAPTEICAASDALSTIKTLQTRVERLEESLGRLLLEKEEWLKSEAGINVSRENCCVTFRDAGGDIEKMIATSGRNCCVSFKSSSGGMTQERMRKEKFLGTMVILVIVALMVIGIVAVVPREKGME